MMGNKESGIQSESLTGPEVDKTDKVSTVTEGNDDNFQSQNQILLKTRTRNHSSEIGLKGPSTELLPVSDNPALSNEDNVLDNKHTNDKQQIQEDQTLSIYVARPSVSVISSNSVNSDFQPHSLAPLVYQKLRNCLLNLPLMEGQEIKEKAIERVASHVTLQNYQAKTVVLMKGSSAKGIFVIIKGTVNVVSENGADVLVTLQEGEYFGEVSVLFDCACTARVQTVTKSQFAVLGVDDAKRLLHKIDTDIIDYFVMKRYLPTIDNMDARRIQRRMALTCLKKLPIFELWSSAAIKELIIQIQPALIIVYPGRSMIVCEQDPPVSLYVIIRGRATIMKGYYSIVEIDAEKGPIIIGEEGLYFGITSAVSIQASTCCQIIPIRQECLQNVCSEFSEEKGLMNSRELKWKASVKRDSVLYQTFPHLLQFEVLYHLLWNNTMFSLSSSKCMIDITQAGIPCSYTKGEKIFSFKDNENPIVLLVLKGQLEIQPNTKKKSSSVMNFGEVFYAFDLKNGEVTARTDCLLLKIDNNAITMAMEQHIDSKLILPSKQSSN